VLSKIELEFLKSPESFDADYRRVLRHRVNSKVRELREEMELLQKWDFGVTGNCNGVTELLRSAESEKSKSCCFWGNVEPSAGFGPATITLPR
jgi:hypothetical protein